VEGMMKLSGNINNNFINFGSISVVVGITVLGGENSKRLDLGIYVKSVTEGGAAWKDGRLKAGKVTACTHDF